MLNTSALFLGVVLTGTLVASATQAQHLQEVGVAGSFNVNQTWAKQRTLTLGSSTLYTDTDRARDDDTGNRASLYARVGLGKGSFFVQPEVAYTSVLGNQYTLEFPRGYFSYAHRIRRLEVAALAGYHLTDKFYLVAGPVLAVNKREKTVLNGLESWQPAYTSLETSPEHVQLLGQLGMGVRLWRFDVGARYEHSLTPYTKHLRFDNQTYAYQQSTNQYILSVGFLLFDKNLPWKK
ncbi:Outer membrane protein beta-barrel domain-containing protein [Hymenobacter gelipurpurascens]|uniref:Outer membrane protein beta-barrel domain-containing protein n=1 Tax=Hymenobacter gelipurpurascens TaxID=89968 RepID=A0A212U9Z4_9BACT|nr:outer membrane beta-barrel protein [Hymenobacter gelipurpurascens]SNC74970.1 Outer membrane protein beta-barrel domain-containing protein [Hymenobacter gelipurpurascens]